MASTLQPAEAPAPAAAVEPPRSRRFPARGAAVALLVALPLTAVPALLAASRPTEFRSEIELRVPAAVARRVEPPVAYVSAFVGGALLRSQIEQFLGPGGWDAYEQRMDRISVRGGERADGGPVVVGVPGKSPALARRLAGFTAQKLLADAALKVPGRRRAETVVAQTLRRLRAPGLDRAARAELRRRLRFARTAERALVPIVPLQLSGPATRPEDWWLARAVRPVTGRPLPDGEPVWSGVAGFLLAASLVATWLLVRRRPAA